MTVRHSRFRCNIFVYTLTNKCVQIAVKRGSQTNKRGFEKHFTWAVLETVVVD